MAREVTHRTGLNVLISIFAMIFSLTSAIPASSPAQADNPPRKILSGWIPYYGIKTALPSALNNADLVSEVNLFWYTLKDERTITDLYSPANPSVPMAGVISAAPSSTSPANPSPAPTNSASATNSVSVVGPLKPLKDAGFLILPTVTDSTSANPATGKSAPLALSNLLAKPSSEKNLVNTFVALATKVGPPGSLLAGQSLFDGIDLDLEDFAFIDPSSTWPTTVPRWVAFIKDLSDALHAKGKILSVTTPPLFNPLVGGSGYYAGRKGYTVYAWQQIASSIDRLRIMAYDYSTSSIGPIGPISWTEAAVQYAISVMPASKVFVGIPGYGRDWVSSVSGTCPTLPINYTKTIAVGAKAATFVQHDAAALAATYKAIPTFVDKYGESTFTYQKIYNGTTASGSPTTCTATRTAWYQDAQAFRVRAGLVAKYKIGGVAEWTFGMEDISGANAIRDVAKAIAPDVVNINLILPVTANYGAVITLLGKVQKLDTTPFANIPWRLEMLTPPSTPGSTATTPSQWGVIASGLSAIDGTFQLALIPPSNAKFRVVTDGSYDRLAAKSPEQSVGVTRLISWSPPTSIKHGVAYKVVGEIAPKVAGVVVLLDNGAPGKAGISNSTPQAVTDSDGRFTFTLKETKLGVYTYRTLTQPDLQYNSGVTSFVIVIVR